MNELKTLKIIENIFQNKYKFIKSHPKWLKNKYDTQLELDGYNEQINIAVEYNGPYHYEEKYYPNLDAFNNKKESDKIKKTLCKEHNILLIVIPYIIKNIYDYILSRLYDAKIYEKYKLPIDYIYMDVINM
jgi:hypothetical protein